MFGLPVSTECKKQLPKKAIYAKFDLKASQRDAFDGDVARIDVVAVVSAVTVPALGAGQQMREFYVLAVQMKRIDYDAKNVILLTKLIHQKMVLALQYDGQTQFAIYHTKLIISDWLPTEQAKLSLSGLNIDNAWDNIIKQTGRIDVEEGKSITEQISDNDRKEKIEEQIKMLERKLVSEKQPRKKREYFEAIKQWRSILNL